MSKRTSHTLLRCQLRGENRFASIKARLLYGKVSHVCVLCQVSPENEVFRRVFVSGADVYSSANKIAPPPAAKFVFPLPIVDTIALIYFVIVLWIFFSVPGFAEIITLVWIWCRRHFGLWIAWADDRLFWGS